MSYETYEVKLAFDEFHQSYEMNMNDGRFILFNTLYSMITPVDASLNSSLVIYFYVSIS